MLDYRLESYDISKHHISIHRFERALPSIPWHLRVLYADAERKLGTVCTLVTKSEIYRVPFLCVGIVRHNFFI